MSTFLPVSASTDTLITQTIDGQPAVTSKDVALRFQKKHKNVLQEIDRLRSILPPEVYGPNFQPIEESVLIPLSGGSRMTRAFLMTEEGFSLLAMGFTGKAAVLWKWQYIKAFRTLKELAFTRQLEIAQEEARQSLSQGAALALSLRPSEREQITRVIGYQKRGFSQSEMAAVMGIHRRTVGKLISAARKLGLLEARHELR